MATALTVVGEEPLKVVGEESLTSKPMRVVGEEPLKVVGEERIGSASPRGPEFEAAKSYAPPPAAPPLARPLTGQPLTDEERAALPFIEKKSSPQASRFLGDTQFEARSTPTGAPVLEGAGQMLRGGKKILVSGPTPTKPANLEDVLSGGSDVIEGAFKAASPLIGVGAAEVPLTTLATLGVATGASKGVEAGAKALGAPPELSRFAGNIAAILAAGVGGRKVLAKMYEAAGSPEVKIGGKFEEPKAFHEMTDEELVAHANAIENNPPKNYDWQKQEIVKEVGKRQAERGMASGGASTESPAAVAKDGPVPPAPEPPRPVVQTPPAEVAIESGHTYETPQGTVKVNSHENGIVAFDLTMPDGQVIPGNRLPVIKFQAMVAPPTEVEKPVTPVVAPAPGSSAAPLPVVGEEPLPVPEQAPPVTPEPSTVPPVPTQLQPLPTPALEHIPQPEIPPAEPRSEVIPAASVVPGEAGGSQPETLESILASAPAATPPPAPGSMAPNSVASKTPEGKVGEEILSANPAVRPLHERINERNTVYHATSVDNFHAILQAGEIKPGVELGGQATVPGVSVARVGHQVPKQNRAVTFALYANKIPPHDPFVERGIGYNKTGDQRADWASIHPDIQAKIEGLVNDYDQATMRGDDEAADRAHQEKVKLLKPFLDAPPNPHFEFESRTRNQPIPLDAVREILVNREAVNDAALADIKAEGAKAGIPVRVVGNGREMFSERIRRPAPTDETTPAPRNPPEARPEYASTQANISGPIADKIREFGKSIPDEALTPSGREDQPHVTVRYGNGEPDESRIAKALEGEGPITAKIKGISVFANVDTKHGKADVLKLDIDSPDLRRLNALIGKAVPHPGETHPEYKPHATLAYVKPGLGKKYAGQLVKGVSGQTVTFDSIAFSGKDDKQVEIPLKGEAQPKRPSAEPQGKASEVYTSTNRKVGVGFDVREARGLTNSFESGYPQEYQPRDTSRKGSRQRVEQRKGDMTAPLMADSGLASDGAPITLKDGVVITRNHGTQALKELYTQKSQRAADYKAWMVKHAADFGIDPEKVAGMKEPVLIRVITDSMTPEEVSTFAKEANTASTARMSDAEMADMLAQRMTGPLMDTFNPGESGRPNIEFVRGLIDGLTVEEQAIFQDRDGKVSQTGARLVRNAIFAKAYPDPRALERMAESESPSLKNISNGMLMAAPDVAKFEEAARRGDRFPLGIGPEIADAAAVIDELVRTGTPVAVWMDQGSMFGRDPVIESLVKVLSDNRRSAKRIGEFLKEYTEGADIAGSPKQETLLGPPEEPKKADVLEAAYSRVKDRWKPQQDLIPQSEDEAKLAGGRLAPGETSEQGPGEVSFEGYRPVDGPSLFEDEPTPEKRYTPPVKTHKLSGYSQSDLLDEDAIEKQRAAQQSYEDRLLGDRLTAQMKSGMAAKAGKLKPAQSGGLFEQDEPQQEGLFGVDLDAYRPTPGFYSQLERTIEAKMPEKASAAQVLAIIRNPQNGVKADEIKWTGLDDWLNQQKGAVTKQQVSDYLKANEVKVEEVMHGGAPAGGQRLDEFRAWRDQHFTQLPSGWEWRNKETGVTFGENSVRDQFNESMGKPTKFGQYVLPGGENYRELLMTLPPQHPNRVTWKQTEPDTWVSTGGDTVSGEHGRFEVYDLSKRNKGFHLYDSVYRHTLTFPSLQEAQDAAERGRTSELTQGDQYKSPHWDEPNVLAHLRFNDRTGPNGEKILHVEEIQSDWLQEAKRKGFRERASIPAGSKLITDSDGRILAATDDEKEAKRLSDKFDAELNDPGVGWIDRDSRDGERAINKANNQEGVPVAPFAKTWQELAFRRALRYAVENGYGSMTWTRSETQAERYHLSKHLDRIEYEPINDPPNTYELAAFDKHGTEVIREEEIGIDRVEELVGKEIAQKILDDAGEPIKDRPYREWRSLSGLDLKVGGEGMKGFYDQILPAYANKYAKKWGAKAGTAKIDATDHSWVGRRQYYEGPEYTLDQIKDTLEQARAGGRDQWESPLVPGRRLGFVFNRVDNTYALGGLAKSMEQGTPFREAVDAIGAGRLAEVLGGTYTEATAPKTETVHSISITPAMRESVMQGQPLFYKPPTIPKLDHAERSDPYVSKAPASVHAALVQIKPLPLEGPISGIASAFVINPSAMELVGRAAGRQADATGPEFAGLHLAAKDAGTLARNLALITKGKTGPVEDLRKALETTSASGKSVVLISDHPDFEQYQQDALTEELMHAIQAQLTGKAKAHLGSGLQGFTATPLYAKAAGTLRRRYTDVTPNSGEEATEVGVRLMRPDGYKELGLTPQEARNLAASYVRELRKAHGTKPAGQVAKEVFDAFRRPGRVAPEPGELTRRPGQERGSGAPGEPGSGLSAFRPGERPVHDGEPRAETEEANRVEAVPGGKVARGNRTAREDSSRGKEVAPGDGGKVEDFLRDEEGTSRVPELIAKVIDRFKQADTPRRNYSGIGSSIKQLVTPGSALNQVEKASTPVFEKALAAGSWQSIASTMTRSAVSAIDKTLKDTGYNWIQMRAMLTQDRLEGLRDRWKEFSDVFGKADEDQVKELMEADDESGRSFFVDLLSNIEGRAGLPEDLGQAAVAMMQNEEWDALGKMASDVFADAASRVATILPANVFDATADYFDKDPKGKQAVEIYRKDIENNLARIHAENEGVFGTKGPKFGLYIPLVPFEPKAPVMGGRRLPLHKPKNPANAFATGLAPSYSLSMAGFVERIARDVRANKRATLIQTLRDEGWVMPKPRSGWDGTFLGPDGREYTGVSKQVSEARTIVNGRKATHIPGQEYIIPQFLWDGLKPMLERDPPNTNDLNRVAHFLNGLALQATPAELVFHSAGVLGAINANTPFLGPTGVDKFLSAPIVRWFAIQAKLFNIDPTGAENLKKLRDMSEAGVIPSKMGKVTFDKEFAEAFGVKRELTFAPMLYGPKGIDARARILMYDIFKAAYGGTDQDTKANLYHFVNQIGNYTPEFQGEIEKWAKRSGMGPFATAGMTRLVNSFDAWTGAGPGDKKHRALQMFMGGALGAIALWALAYHYATGKWPTEDKRAKLFQIPVGQGHGRIDKYRHSKLGNLLWGDGPEVGYVNFGMFFPLVVRGSRLLGLSSSFETKQLGGNTRQVLDSVQRDVLNSLAHPFLGPATTAAFVMGTGNEPYVTSFIKSGKPQVSMFPAFSDKRKPGFVGGLSPALSSGHVVKHPGGMSEFGARTAASVAALNGFYGDLGQNTGIMGSERDTKGSFWLKLPLSLVLPGAVKGATNPYGKAEMLRKDRAAGTK